jgi:hypothetical protein
MVSKNSMQVKAKTRPYIELQIRTTCHYQQFINVKECENKDSKLHQKTKTQTNRVLLKFVALCRLELLKSNLLFLENLL